MVKRLRCFQNEDMKKFEAEAKVALLATLSEHRQPHITFLSSLQAKTTNTLMFGQFSEGLSKRHVRLHPNTGFLIMTLERELWRGKARWTHEVKHGPDYEYFNSKPMFRYNAYFGIHTVHYLELREVTPRIRLPVPGFVAGSLKTLAARGAARTHRGAGQGGGSVMTSWAQQVFRRLDTLKFLAWVDTDGFPTIVPALQCQAPDGNRIVFSPSPFGSELRALEPGTSVAAFAQTLQVENVLVRGVFRGYERHRGVRIGIVELNWAYNSMPPVPGQIYPPVELTPVSEP